jgi:hypothetical protein
MQRARARVYVQLKTTVSNWYGNGRISEAPILFNDVFTKVLLILAIPTRWPKRNRGYI